MKSKFNGKSMFNKLINNKYFLYLVALVAFVDILGYVMRKQFSAVLFFYLVGMITYYYTKNMTVVLGLSLIVTSLMHFVKNMTGFKEGMDNDSETTEADELETDELEADELETDELEEGDEEITSEIQLETSKLLKDLNSKKKESKSGYQNQIKLKPGLYNMPNKKQLEKQLGKADHLEAAYDNLEKVVGENGIKSMSNNTKDLIKQQNELLKGLKEVTPALNEAMGAIGKIDLGNLTNLFNKVNTKPE